MDNKGLNLLQCSGTNPPQAILPAPENAARGSVLVSSNASVAIVPNVDASPPATAITEKLVKAFPSFDIRAECRAARAAGNAVCLPESAANVLKAASATAASLLKATVRAARRDNGNDVAGNDMGSIVSGKRASIKVTPALLHSVTRNNNMLPVDINKRGSIGPHLVIAPTSTIGSWKREMQRWCPGFKVLATKSTVVRKMQ